ncbi:hypothetical protein F5B17DRAFT_432021 [Nemania serpens]|nr:hypothetical protein F5B17DRAFT_432021 [Nemania serpens]
MRVSGARRALETCTNFTQNRNYWRQWTAEIFAGKRIPSFQELQKAHIAYLDAVIEEVDRLNAFTVTRHAKVGTQIKGYPTPKAPGCSWFPTGWDQWHNVSQSTRQGTPLARGQTAGLLGETEGLAVFRSER